MSSDSSKSSCSPTPQEGDDATSSRPQLKSAPRSVDVDGEAMETFSFHVSAAESADLKQKQQSEAQAGASLSKRLLQSPRPSSCPTELDQATTIQGDISEQVRNIHIVTTAKPQRKTSSWMASLLLHVALLLPFGFVSQAVLPAPEDSSILVSFEPSEPPEEIEVFEDVELESTLDIETADVEIASEVLSPEVAGLTDLSAESALQNPSGELAVHSEGLQDLRTLFGDAGQGLSGVGEGLGDAPTADFFGTKVQGNRIVYVLDNSGGMVSGELEMLVAELLRSVESLTRKQHFYIIFYSDALYPLFYPNAPQHFIRATDENKRLLEEWLDTVELCLGNVVDEALAAATSIRPDVVYLLTDGDLDSTRDQRRIRFLLDRTGRSFPIHTFGLGTGETGKAALKLKQVAEANGGSFQAVEITPDAVALAKIKARPYHNKSPGEVWGLRVGKRQR